MERKNNKAHVQSHHQNSFPDLPPYRAPSTGFMSYIPLPVLPYAELARIEMPGFAVLYIVHVYGILHAGIILKAPLSEVLYLIAFFFPACWLLMCVNFAWNDSCDCQYDRKVARTRHRPLVRGAVSLPAAITFDCALAILLAVFLAPLPGACTVYAIPMALGCFIYPLSKRWTNFPQLVLGVVLSTGTFMGAAAVGAIPLPYPSHAADILNFQAWITPQQRHAISFFYSYLTIVAWTLFLEIVYSFQDVLWDENAGIGTITKLLKGRGTAKALLLLLAIIQAVLHAQTGIATQAHSAFWPFSVTLTFIILITEIFCVDLDKEESCAFWFAVGNILTGLAMLIGYAGEFFTQIR